MSEVRKPLILIPELGEQGVLPDNGIINAGGVEGPNFLVGGKALIFADGTASDGSGKVINVATDVNVIGYEFIQETPSTHWIIPHNKNSMKIQITIWDTENEIVFPDVAKIANAEIVHVIFGSPQAGRAILMLF